MENFAQVRSALEAMENAAGSADAEMSKIEKSLDYKINRLKLTWVGALQEITDREDIGKLIDMLTSLSESVTGLLGNLGLLGTLSIGGSLFLSLKENVGRVMLVA